MKRLLKICFDILSMSFSSIIIWFSLGLILDQRLVNVFSITYPLFCLKLIIYSIFSIGANISEEKDNNKYASFTGLIIGSIIGIILMILLVLNIDNYILFMNMDPDIYREFTIYSVMIIFIQLIFEMLINKLYYKNKNNLANKYTVLFNAISIFAIILSSFIFDNYLVIIIVPIILLFSFVSFIVLKEYDFKSKFKFKINIKNCLKYDSSNLITNIIFLFIYIFGLRNVMSYGEEYTLAITFVALITDTQWDVISAISTVIKIDISKDKFNYKKHLKNAYKLTFYLLISIFVLLCILISFYNLNIFIVVTYLAFQIFNFSLYPLYEIKKCYLQLNYSVTKVSINTTISNILRFLFSFLNNPYCTSIGQSISGTYDYLTYNKIFKKNYIINKQGKIIRK